MADDQAKIAAEIAKGLKEHADRIADALAKGMPVPPQVVATLLLVTLRVLEGIYDGSAPPPQTRRIITPSKH